MTDPNPPADVAPPDGMSFMPKPEVEGAAPGKHLDAQAKRALAEAAARRTQTALEARDDEINGPSGPEPTRYGDWERKGVAYDF